MGRKMGPNKKKSRLAESGEGEGSRNVDEKLVRSISKIKYIQEELKKINVEEDSKVLEVLQEYSELHKEIYTRRNEVLLTIKGFWLTVLMSHPTLGEFLNGEDLKILKYLLSLDVEELPQIGYSITFNFSPNPYFENKKLTKTYSFPDEATAVVTGATINWKEGLDKGLEDMSLFLWLSRTQQISVSAAVLDKVACTIKECLWPDPLKYIIDDKSLDVEGGMQNVDEEGGQDDDEIEQEGDEEGSEADTEDGIDDNDEIEEREGDEEGWKIDAEEDELLDGEIDQVDEEGVQGDLGITSLPTLKSFMQVEAYLEKI